MFSGKKFDNFFFMDFGVLSVLALITHLSIFPMNTGDWSSNDDEIENYFHYRRAVSSPVQPSSDSLPKSLQT